MSKKTHVRMILIGAAVVLVALALPKIRSFDRAQRAKGTASTPRDQRMQVHMHVVQPEKLGDRVMTVGNILSNEEVEIRSEVSGKIEKIFFREGGRVKADDTLLKINDAELQAQLLRAKARHALAEQQEERQQQLFERNLVSQQDYENAVANVNLMKAEVQLIKAQLGKTEVRAPFDGSIGLRYTSEGSYITPSTLITTLQDKSTVKIDFAVPEKYVADIRQNDKITFKTQGQSRTFTGTIYAIDPKIDPGTRTLRLRAVSPNQDGALFPGSLATVDVSFQEKEALMIPSYALIPELKGHKVFLYKDGKAESRRVEIGRRTDELVEIAQGLQAGDILITSGILQIRPGMAVLPAQNQSVSSPSGIKGNTQ